MRLFRFNSLKSVTASFILVMTVCLFLVSNYFPSLFFFLLFLLLLLHCCLFRSRWECVWMLSSKVENSWCWNSISFWRPYYFLSFPKTGFQKYCTFSTTATSPRFPLRLSLFSKRFYGLQNPKISWICHTFSKNHPNSHSIWVVKPFFVFCCLRWLDYMMVVTAF